MSNKDTQSPPTESGIIVREIEASQKDRAVEGAKLALDTANAYRYALALSYGKQEASLLMGEERRVIEEDGTFYVVRFVDRNMLAYPHESELKQPTFIDAGLQIASIKKGGGMYGPWDVNGLFLYDLGRDGKDEWSVGVHCLGGDRHRRLDDTVGPNNKQIELSENKLSAYAEALKVSEKCFMKEELSQPGGIIQVLLKQAHKKYSRF